MLELCDGKLSRAVLRRERGLEAPDLSGYTNSMSMSMIGRISNILLMLVGCSIVGVLLSIAHGVLTHLSPPLDGAPDIAVHVVHVVPTKSLVRIDSASFFLRAIVPFLNENNHPPPPVYPARTVP